MDMQGEFLQVMFVYEAINFSFQTIRKQNRGFHGTSAKTGGTCFRGFYIAGRTR